MIETEPRTANGMRKSMNASSDVEIQIDIGNSKVALYFTPRQYAKLVELRINETPVVIELVADAQDSAPANVRMSLCDGHMDIKGPLPRTLLDVTLAIQRATGITTAVLRGSICHGPTYEVIE